MTKLVSGFSKLSKTEKIDWLVSTYLNGNETAKETILTYWNSNEKLQNLHDDFIENTISNFYLPLGVAPNFNINGAIYTIPMVIEESSVVAAASKAAKFWGERGGFKTEVLSTEKIGQVHFTYAGNSEELQSFFYQIKPQILQDAQAITKNMEKRGGGILDVVLVDKTKHLKDYYQLHATFETLDAMGANFINSCLEQFATTLKREAQKLKTPIHVVMSILSNYVPNCLVKASVSCKVEELADKGIHPEEFAEKFIQAVNIAKTEPYRAVTHNKGIMNGIDAVVLATGNDFRAIEAGVHAYASRTGRYSSLTDAKVENGIFTFWIELPLALGTVGGLTKLHPLVKLALDILGNPTAKELMQVVAVAGLAQNFGALRSLVTTGIQEGHMKMHLMNILNQFEATVEEKNIIVEKFKTETVTHSGVVKALEELRA
ncbi:hydroxymethylglutaryl-CoA reductase, degradative [Aurantibacter aestuarii]|uniref:3-hydroxy-3-methylglutaryl coenzyme A reductase n=1 Tax=Aurantibacter aestuarii TaxID=1266046 RepID=A0A2T1NFP5_9FLAO|nr:hydroxymethylglutaryl-CoA reductase, degradative [Aurantibacter aestuarii]PSG91548.1 hydroxymethylglutaryl-CoA reductase, degradative [Aurantibacter aestuarii]